LKGTPLQSNLEIARRIVAGELAAKAGRFDEAVTVLREAVGIEDEIPYSEPPIWHHPVRQVLGAVLLEAGRAAEAEAVYREDLVQLRENGWSLFGLARALEAQGKTVEAEAVQARYEKAWPRADIRLTSSRILGDANAPAPAIKPATHSHHPHAHAIRSEETQIMVHSLTLPTGVTLQYAERGSASGVPVLLLHVLFTLGLAFILSTCTVFSRDVAHLTEVGLVLSFWLTPIVYPASMAPPKLQALFGVSPLAAFAIAYQDVLFWGRVPPSSLLAVLLGWTAVALLGGYAIFRRFSPGFAEEV